MSDSTSTTGGGLHFEATINESSFNASINGMNTKINGVATNAVAQGEKVEGFAKKVSEAQTGIIERLKTKLAEFKASADQAMSVSGIEKYNAKIQEFEAEIKRLANVGKVGFDDLGNSIKKSYERPTGTLARLIELQRIYKTGSASMTNPDLIAKYNQKLQETAAQITRTKNIGKEGFDELGNAIKAAYERPTGTLNRLIELQKIYKDGAASMTNPDLIAKYNKKLEETAAAILKAKNAGKSGFDELGNAIKKTLGYQETLTNRLKLYNEAIKAQPNTANGAENIVALNKKIGQTQEELTRLNNAGKKGFDELGNSIEKTGGLFSGLGSQIMGLVTNFLSFYAIVSAIKSVISHNVEISDSFVDVQRTAKLSAKEVDGLGEELKKLNTRTNLDGLLDIGFIGGRLGVAKDDLVGFISTVDQLAVVLKKELPGGAEAVAESLGKIVNIYKITQNEGVSLEFGLRKVGSTLLDLAHSGPVTVKYLQDFSLGVAGSAASAKLSFPTIAAYGAILGQAGTIASSAAISVTRLVNDLSTKRGKYFAIAQLADSSLTVEKFNDLINNDTKKALELFFKGLKSGNPSQIEFNDRIKSVGITTGKVSNAVKTLANNQEELAVKTSIASKGFEHANSTAQNFALANNSFSASWDKLKNSMMNYFTSASNGRAAANLLNIFTENRSESELLAESYENNKHKVEELNTSLDPLVKKYDELKKKGKLNRDEQVELKNVTSKIGQLLPDVISKFNDYGKALDINRGKVDEATKSQKELLLAQNRTAIAAAQSEFNYTSDKLKTAVQNKGKKPGLGTVFYEQFVNGGATPDKERLVNQQDEIKLLQEQARKKAEELKAMGVKLTKDQQKALDVFKIAIKGKPTEILGTGELTVDQTEGKTTDEIKAEIKALQDANKKLGIESAVFKANVKQIVALKKELKIANGGVDNIGISEANQYQTALKSRNSLQDKIIELNKKATDSELSSNLQEIESVKDKYAKMRAEAVAFNNDPKNKAKGLSVSMTGLAEAQRKEINNTIYKQDTARLGIELDKQKELYAAFEQYKTSFGESAAKERFEKDIDTSKTFIKVLQDQYSKLIFKGVTASITGKSLSGTEQERLNDGTKRQKEELKVETENYNALLVANATYEKEKALATERYNAKFLKLQGASNEGNRAVLTQGYKEELDQLSENLLLKSDVYKKAAEEAIVLTRDQIVKEIASLEVILGSGTIPTEQVAKIQKNIDDLRFTLKIGIDKGNVKNLKDEYTRVAAQLDLKDQSGNKVILSDKDYKDIISRLAGIQLKIKEIDSNGDGTVSWGEKVAKNFAYLKGDTADFTAGLSNDLGRLSSGFNELSGALGGNNTQAGYLLDTIGQLTKAAADAAGAVTSFASGDIIGGVTKTISAVTSVLSIGKKVKEMNAAARKEVEDFYKNAIKGEREYQDLLKERELQTIRNNKIALQGIRDEVALRKQQIDAYSKESIEIMGKLQGESFIQSEEYKHGTWFRKAQVNKTYGSLAGKSFAELSQLLAQGKLEGDTKALVERLKELEQKGYDAEKAIADLAKQTSELFTGTNADTITNSLAEMFKSGKTSAKDLADFFKQTMDDAALSIFKNKVLAGAMESFYAEFDKAAQSGDELTSDEIARLNGLFTSLTGDALKKFEEFKKITGSDLKPKDSSGGTSSVGNIRADLTEQTGGKLEGLWRAQFDLTSTLVTYSAENNSVSKATSFSASQILEISRQNLDVAIRNEQNTFRTANNTDSLSSKLDQIISNTKKDTSVRGGGFQTI